MASESLTAALRETLALFGESGAPLATTEVADRLDLGRRSTYERLERLVEHDRLETKTVGASARVWWRPSPAVGRTGGREPSDAVGSAAAGRTRAEQSRTRDREALASLVESVEEYAIFTLDPGGRVQTWNPGAERIKGYAADDAIGEHVSAFYTDEDRAAGVPEENLAAAAANGSVEDEGWRVRADGSRFWADVTVTAIRNDGGELEGYAKVTRDMTERRERERSLRHERNLLETVQEVSPVGIGIFDATGEPLRLNRRFTELLGRDGTGPGEYRLGQQPLLDADGDVIPYAERPAPRALETGEPVVDRRIRVDGPDGETRWLSVNATPLSGETDGVVVTMVDVTHIKRQARELERQRDDLESELGAVFERVDDGFVALDDEFRFTHVNQRASELLSRSAGELVGEDVRDAFELGPDTAASLEESLATQRSVSVEEHYEPLGRWFEATVYPSETGLSVYFRDVTERKERERDLELYEAIVSAVDDGVYVLDEEFRFVVVNDAYVELTGYDRDELLGTHCSLVVDESVSAESNERLREITAGSGSSATIEADVHRADGTTVRAESNFTTLPREGAERPWKVGVVRDVTEREGRERELERYETLVETVNDGIYIVDQNGYFTLANDTYARRVGHTTEEVVGSHVTDVFDDEAVLREAKRLEEELAAGERTTASLEAEFTGPEGETWIEEATFTLMDTDTGHERVGVVRDVTEHKEREQELRRRIRQQEAVADLGQRALEDHDLDDLLAEASELVADVLDTDYCKVLDLDCDGEELLLRQGVGWNEGIVGSAAVSATDGDSQAAYTLAESEPVVVDDLDAETRFSGPNLLTDHDVRSGISTVIGSLDDPWGILGTHDTASREFSGHDVTFVQSVANTLASAVDRHRYEGELVRQRERLGALNDLNDIVRGVTDAVVEQSSREEIEATVCERLAASDTYQFAWLGEVDTYTREVGVRTAAGVEGYLDDVTVSVDPDDDRSRGPTGRAFLTGEVKTTADVRTEPWYDPWREAAADLDVRSSAAIPIVHDGTTYGVLNVYAGRPAAFEGEERAVLGQLGEVVGHAIAAADRKQALMTDDVTELEFVTPDLFDALGVDASAEGELSFERTVSVGDGVFLEYGTVDRGAVDALEALVEELPHFEELTVADPEAETTRFELRMLEPPIVSAVASHGGYVERAGFEDGDYHMTIHLPPTVAARRLIDVIQEAYPTARLLTRRQVTRSDDVLTRVHRTVTEELTDRQRAALEAAVHSGFFEWPREASGEDVAGSLDVAPSTFHQHLRKAERKVFGSLLSSPST